MDDGSERRASASEEPEPSLRDVLKEMASMNSNLEKKISESDEKMDKKIEDLNTNIDGKLDGLQKEVSATFDAVKEEMREILEEVTKLKTQNDNLRRENLDLRSRLNDVDLKLDDLECRSRRNNLLFYGLPRQRDESNQDCEERVQEFLTDKLELSRSVSFDRVHRLNDKPDSPVIARCTFYKEKTTILKAKGKLRGTNVFIGEDFSQRVRAIRKALNPHLKEAKRQGKRVAMIFDYLLIEGKKFVLNDSGKGIKEVGEKGNK